MINILLNEPYFNLNEIPELTWVDPGVEIILYSSFDILARAVSLSLRGGKIFKFKFKDYDSVEVIRVGSTEDLLTFIEGNLEDIEEALLYMISHQRGRTRFFNNLTIKEKILKSLDDGTMYLADRNISYLIKHYSNILKASVWKQSD